MLSSQRVSHSSYFFPHATSFRAGKALTAAATWSQCIKMVFLRNIFRLQPTVPLPAFTAAVLPASQHHRQLTDSITHVSSTGASQDAFSFYVSGSVKPAERHNHYAVCRSAPSPARTVTSDLRIHALRRRTSAVQRSLLE